MEKKMIELVVRGINSVLVEGREVARNKAIDVIRSSSGPGYGSLPQDLYYSTLNKILQGFEPEVIAWCLEMKSVKSEIAVVLSEYEDGISTCEEFFGSVVELFQEN